MKKKHMYTAQAICSATIFFSFHLVTPAFCDSANNYYYNGNAEANKGDMDGAISNYTKAIELDPNYAKAYGNRGLAKKNKGDLIGAMADYNRAIELDPSLAQVYFNRGNAERDKGDLYRAMADYTRAIELKNDFIEAYDNRGGVKRLLGDLDGAIADYCKAIEQDPQFTHAYNNRGAVKERKGDLVGAMADYNRAIELNPKFAEAYYNRGCIEHANGKLEDAQADFKKAIELNPEIRERIHADGFLSNSEPNPRMEAMAGQSLNAKEARDLEGVIAKNPDDLSARTELLGYYSMARFTSVEAMEADRTNILWIIRNHPEAEIAGLPFCQIDAIMDRDGYNEAKHLWLEQTEAHSQNATILGNAAQFFFIHDKKLAEDLLKQAQRVDPNNPHWSERLGHLYALQSGKDTAAKSLAEYEKAQAGDNSEASKFHRLDALAKSAFEAGDVEKASRYANELLKMAQKFPDDWNYGNAIHQANNVLGRIALKQGEVKQADKYLLKAGQTPGSPQLDSFGPNMSLAKELLETGERETVLQYFELCRKFWKMGGEDLDNWTKEVKAGKVPRFGANLVY